MGMGNMDIMGINDVINKGVIKEESNPRPKVMKKKFLLFMFALHCSSAYAKEWKVTNRTGAENIIFC